MSEEKKTIVRDLKFGGLMHIPPLRVHHQVLRELANNFKLGENRLKTGYGDLFPQKVDYKKLSDDDKEIFRRFQGKKRAERPPKPWIANWSKEQLDERMTAEREENMYVLNNDCLPSRMDSKKRKKSQEDEDSDSESESTDETQSKKKKVVVEHSSPEEDQFYDGYSTSYEIGSEDLDELLRENNEKSAAEGEKEADLRSTEGHYVSSETIPDVNLGSDDPSSQGHTEQSSVNRPTESMLSLVQELATLLNPPNNLKKAQPHFPPAPSKICRRRCCPDDDGTDSIASTQEGASTQEADRAKTPETANLLEQLEDFVQKIVSSAAKEESKSPQIQKETGGESSGKFETPAEINQHMGDMKEKCYICGTRVKTYADGSTNEFDNVCTLIAQDKYILNRMHLASLQAGSYIESEIVSAMCLILNQKNDERFQEQVYCLPPDIMSMAVSKHPNGEFISPKTNKEFKNFAHVCYSGHWWLWVIDTTKRRFYILDPLHKKAPSDERKQLNKFIGYVISRMRAYAGGAPLKKKENELEIKPTYVNISGQKSSYDCAIYVMKWLELIEPENIKRAKYEWDNWPQDEVDHYRVEYASQILFSEMNKERDQAIRASNAIRLSKPSSVLLSPFCQINSTDIETE
ncbi:uncharacterized protein DS421_15g505830 [Arachis hypogaea]|nr:uncharacterized protein DS421_15g505830 [Arachis hypogaea]